ncbi:MAG: ABC transporter permease [Verrucomicrobiales bacterium]|nr:ABC transporter permease [Verrucomicrobiales bacterium]
MQDARLALRQLLRSPGFTAAATLVLALGIGLNTAMFSAIYALAFNPRPFPAPDRLVQLYSHNKKEPAKFQAFSYPVYRELRERRDLFAGVLAQSLTFVAVGDGGEARRAFAAVVSVNYFEVLGVPLLRGRGFTAAEGSPGADLPTVVVSHFYWRNSGSDPELVGSTLRLNGRLFTVVGITPEGFAGTNATLGPEFYFPLGVYHWLGDERRSLQDANSFALNLVGRLQSGIGIDVAGSALAGAAADVERLFPVEQRDQTFIVGPLPRFVAGSEPKENGFLAGVFGTVLMGLTGTVLFIVSLNLAGLLLVRGHARRKEFAIRQALGGTRARLVRQLLTEGLALALVGGALGTLCAVSVTRLLVASVSSRLSVALPFTAPGPGVLVGTTLFFSVLATLLFALGPALTLLRRDLLPGLQEIADNGGGRRRRWRPRHPLIVAQIALSLALVIGAGLFARWMGRLQGADSGIDASRTLIVEFDASLGGRDQAQNLAILRTVGERLASVPGVAFASVARSTPHSFNRSERSVRRAGTRPIPGARPSSADEGLAFVAPFNAVGADYFAAIGRPLLRGRAFTRTETDEAGAPLVAIIDEPLAARLWPGEEAVGRRLEWASDEASASPGRVGDGTFEIVGIASSMGTASLDGKPPGAIYVPFAQGFEARVHFILRNLDASDGAQVGLRELVRHELQAAAPGVPLFKVRTFREHQDASLVPWLFRCLSAAAVAVGVVAAVIAIIGLYGAKAYSVSRRTREIGLRLALGAKPSDLRQLILREGLVLGASGIGLGLLLGAAFGRLLSGIIFDLDGLDPFVFGVAGLALFATALAASWFPARRAARVDPMVALRTE